MLQKLEYIKERWQEVERELSNPATMSDMKRFAQLNKEYKDLTKIVDEYKIYRNLVSNIEANKQILATEKDEEMREMAKMDLDELLVAKEEKEEEIRVMLIPKKFVAVRVAMRLLYLPAICTACTCVFVSARAGKFR